MHRRHRRPRTDRVSAPADTPSRWPLRQVIAALVAGVLLLLGGFLMGRLMVPSAAQTPSTDSAEAGFARDMQTHHQQAVEMALIIRDSTQNEAIRTLAYDIATAQGQQAGQMYGWLNVWGLAQASTEPPMTWMMQPTQGGGPHEMGTAPMTGMEMPGFATPEQIDALKAANGEDADKLFLELMIAHHAGGVEMAQAVLERSSNDVVITLAGNIVRSQQSEMSYMKDLLAEI